MDEAEARAAVAKSTADKAASVTAAYENQGKPTPTQEENDLAALGVHVDPHEPDGSPEVEAAGASAGGMSRRQSEPNRPSGGGYQTRGASPSREQPHAPAANREPPKTAG